MKKDVFQNCPTYQSERFEIRKMEMKDAHGLFQCYSNPQAARYFNGDCCGDDFYYTDYEKFLECMKFWESRYQVRDFVRFTIVDQKQKEIAGMVEICPSYKYSAAGTWINQSRRNKEKRKQKGKGKPMEYAVFKQQIMEQAKRILPQEEGYVITIVDQTEYGLGEMLIINKSDKEVVPGISMEEMYQDFSQNKKSIEEVIETIQDTVNTAFMMIPEIDGTQGIDFRDYDCIKDLLVVELERSEFNGEHLSHGIFEKQPMGALVLYLRLEQKNQLVMVRLGRDVLEVCGVSQSTMMKQAMENTIKINPPVVMPVDTNGRFPYFILSNREGRNGATTITYPGMLEQLRKMAGMDFYVIPANIHEVLIVGKTENAPIRYLREALKQRNREMGIQQMLSDHVYEYSGRDKKLKRCLDEKKKNRER